MTETTNCPLCDDVVVDMPAHMDEAHEHEMRARRLNPADEVAHMADGLTQRAMELIGESRRTDSIVHAPWTPGLARELLVESDGGVETQEVVEFWGADWRVHLERAVRS
jgi:hypothetical protein